MLIKDCFVVTVSLSTDSFQGIVPSNFNDVFSALYYPIYMAQNYLDRDFSG